MNRLDLAIIEGKLEEIAAYLHHMNRRDRLRTLGAFLRTTVWLIIFVMSTLYIAQNADSLLQTMTEKAASAAAKYSKNGSQDLLRELMKQPSTPQKQK